MNFAIIPQFRQQGTTGQGFEGKFQELQENSHKRRPAIAVLISQAEEQEKTDDNFLENLPQKEKAEGANAPTDTLQKYLKRLLFAVEEDERDPAVPHTATFMYIFCVIFVHFLGFSLLIPQFS